MSKLQGGEKMINTKLLRAEFVKNGYTQKDIAKMLGKCEKTLTTRLKNGDLMCSEAQILIDELKIKNPAEIFFSAE